MFFLARQATSASLLHLKLPGNERNLKCNYRAEDDMKKSYHSQKGENTKLQQQITTLKSDKTNLQQHLLDLQRRVAELELQIGHDEHH
jgi:predicted  nucleic acid-binding Zn-ribbon protein